MCQGDIQDVLPVRGQENYGKTVWASRIEAGTQGKLQNSFLLMISKIQQGSEFSKPVGDSLFSTGNRFLLREKLLHKKAVHIFSLNYS